MRWDSEHGRGDASSVELVPVRLIMMILSSKEVQGPVSFDPATGIESVVLTAVLRHVGIRLPDDDVMNPIPTASATIAKESLAIAINSSLSSVVPVSRRGFHSRARANATQSCVGQPAE